MESVIRNKHLDILHILRNQIDSSSYINSILSENERALLNLNRNRIISLKDEVDQDLVLAE